ncbi:MAG: hypothetical protein JNL12_09830 [Planctomycetes bacterium]|nr:hypothetical protein [Planctomycetota bacterium]
MRAAAVSLLFAACVAGEPAAPSALDGSGGVVTVEFGGDQFVHCAGERQPYDAFVVRMRRRLRGMDGAQRATFVVELRLREGVVDPEALRRAEAEMNRCMDELEIMGVRQARWL